MKNPVHDFRGAWMAAGATVTCCLFLLTSMTPQALVAAPQPTGLQGRAIFAKCDPRTPISSLPFTIDKSGSYFLTRTLTGMAGESGISIESSNVTIDLNGFSLLGVPGSLDGINFDGGPHENIAVFNGGLVDWGRDGIGGQVTAATYSSFEKLRVMRSGRNGIFVGVGCTIASCISQGNASQGVITSGRGTIVNTVSSFNLRGFVPNPSSVLRGCVATSNAEWGFSLTSGAGVLQTVISECVSSGNGTDGFAVEQGSVLAHSSAFNNGLDGIRSRESAVLGCAALSNSDDCDTDGASSVVVDTLNCP